METELYTKFKKARKDGRKISFKWIICYAKAIYRQIYPQRILPLKGAPHKKVYFSFKFSSSWYNGFRRRYNISLRASTKRAQKSLDDLFPVIQNWLQYNRQLTVVRPDSICGIP